MEFFPSLLSREESDIAIDRMEAHYRTHGFTFFAAEWIERAPFIGFIGLAHVPFEAVFTPAIEIGWRLDRPFWNHGLATEGAQAVLNYAFRTLNLEEVVSFTAAGNIRSRRVMEKIGMKQDRAGDFNHPRLSAGHALSRHVLYRLTKVGWSEQINMLEM